LSETDARDRRRHGGTYGAYYTGHWTRLFTVSAAYAQGHHWHRLIDANVRDLASVCFQRKVAHSDNDKAWKTADGMVKRLSKVSALPENKKEKSSGLKTLPRIPSRPATTNDRADAKTVGCQIRPA
jgi:hypothetical protein